MATLLQVLWSDLVRIVFALSAVATLTAWVTPSSLYEFEKTKLSSMHIPNWIVAFGLRPLFDVKLLIHGPNSQNLQASLLD
jgi:hypothetical protein